MCISAADLDKNGEEGGVYWLRGEALIDAKRARLVIKSRLCVAM